MPDDAADAPNYHLDLVQERHDDLLLARREAHAAERALVEAITQAIEHGHSWAALGATMGLRRQTAWDWYQRHHG